MKRMNEWKDISELQRVQNCIARVVIQVPRFIRSVYNNYLGSFKIPQSFQKIHYDIQNPKIQLTCINTLADLPLLPKCSKHLRSSNSFFCSTNKRLIMCGGLSLYMCPYKIPKQFYHSENYLNIIYLVWLSVIAQGSGLPVDEPSLLWIMKHDHAKDLCASDIGPLMIRRYMCLRDVATRLLSYLIKPNQYSPFLGQMISF